MTSLGILMVREAGGPLFTDYTGRELADRPAEILASPNACHRQAPTGYCKVAA